MSNNSDVFLLGCYSRRVERAVVGVPATVRTFFPTGAISAGHPQ